MKHPVPRSQKRDLHPTDQGLSVGAPDLHPTDKDPSVGAPDLHPTDQGLSVGAPDLGHPRIVRNQVFKDLELVASIAWPSLENFPQGLKPAVYAPMAARLKPCPFKTGLMQPVLWRGFGQGFGAFAHLGGALDFVPVEGLAVDGALERLEQHDGEKLAVGEALQPDVEEQPAVALVGGVTPLQAEGHRGGDEVDEQEAKEVDHQLFKAGRGGRFRVVVAIDEVVDDAGHEHDVDERRNQRQKHLEDENVGQGEQAHGLVADEGGAMFPHRLQDAERPAEALAHQAPGVDGRFSVSQRAVFVVDLEPLLEQVHGQVGILGHGVQRIAAGGLHRRGAPCADGARNHGDHVEQVESAALEVLAGDVFQGLPARPQVHAVAHLGVAGHGADRGILKVRNQLGDGVGGDHGVGVDADVDFFVHALQSVVERGGLAFIALGENLHAPGGDLLRVGRGGHFGGAVLAIRRRSRSRAGSCSRS